MRRLTTLLCALALASLTVSATTSRVSGTLTVTNVPSAGDTIQVNSSAVRYWVAALGVPSTNIVIGSDEGYCATNVLAHAGLYPWGGGVWTAQSDTNVLQFTALPGEALTITVGGTWGSLVMSTQSVVTTKGVVVPFSAISGVSVRTNIADQLTSDLEDYSNVSFSTGTTLLSQYLDLSTSQTVSGAKGITNVASSFAGTILDGSTLAKTDIDYATNAVGIHFYDDTPARRFAIAPNPDGHPSIYNIASSEASGLAGIPANYTPNDETILNALIGDYRYGQLSEDNTWLGVNQFTTITNSTLVDVTITNALISGEIGYILLGTLESVDLQDAAIYDAISISGYVDLLHDGSWTNAALTTVTTTNLTVEDDLMLPRTDVTSLTTGDNAACAFSDAVYVRISSGPTGDFTIHGIAGGTDGRVIVVQNDLGYHMTLADESGIDATPANRIQTQTDEDVTLELRGIVTLIYDGSASRWVLLSTSEPPLQSYADLIEVNASGTTNTITTAGTWYQWTSSAVNSAAGVPLVTASAATDNITIGDAGDGIYMVNAQVSFGGTAGAVVEGVVAINGAADLSLSYMQTLDAAGSVVSASICGLVDLSTGDTVDLRFTSDDNGDAVHLYYVRLALHRVQ